MLSFLFFFFPLVLMGMMMMTVPRKELSLSADIPFSLPPRRCQFTPAPAQIVSVAGLGECTLTVWAVLAKYSLDSPHRNVCETCGIVLWFERFPQASTAARSLYTLPTIGNTRALYSTL